MTTKEASPTGSSKWGWGWAHRVLNIPPKGTFQLAGLSLKIGRRGWGLWSSRLHFGLTHSRQIGLSSPSIGNPVIALTRIAIEDVERSAKCGEGGVTREIVTRSTPGRRLRPRGPARNGPLSRRVPRVGRADVGNSAQMGETGKGPTVACRAWQPPLVK
jgi:hypothetical protein